MHKNINRREFVAISTAATAASAISSSALARPIQSSTSATHISAPTLALAVASLSSLNQARLIPHTRMSAQPQLPISSLLSLVPLPCVDGRLAADAGITIELYHPIPDLHSILYSAHNITIPNKSIPAFGSSINSQARSNSKSQISLRITQKRKNQSQTTQLSIGGIGTYLLAIPTTLNNSSANFRFTSAHLDTAGQITKLSNPMPAASSRCAYFSITISEKSTGE